MDISKTLPSASIPMDLQNQALEKAKLLKAQGTAAGLDPKERAKLKKVSQDFEALFVNMMLKSMRSTVGKDELTGGGTAEETYRALLDNEYATAVSRRGDLGIAKMVEKELIKAETRRKGQSVDLVR